MKKVLKAVLLASAAMLSAVGTSAHAGAISTGNFSAAATGGSGGYYYFAGHKATQTFTSSLSSVESMDLTLNLLYASISQNLGFTFYLNGATIGTAIIAPGPISSKFLSFDFASVDSIAGGYTLLMSATQPVCEGCGSVAFSSQNLVRFEQVPEPMSVALLGAGLLGLGLSRKRLTK